MRLNKARAYRAAILHFSDRPDPRAGTGYHYFEDGVLLVDDQGCVQDLDSAHAMQSKGLDLAECEHFPDHLILPGMIDSHIHSPQTGVIASYGEQLIDWLNHYTFPAEAQYADEHHAHAGAEQFLDLLLANGTTTAMVYTSVFAQSTDAFFHAAERRNLRMIAGKVMMNRNAPEVLTDTLVTGERECRALIETWHGRSRLHYAVTPRFAPTSTPEQLQLAGKLLREYPGLYLQTHLSENHQEVAWVEELFPQAQDYLDVYDRAGLLGPRSVFGHGLHLNDRELQRLGQSGSSIAFCPTSNLFLGSGLLDVQRLNDFGVPVAVATDVGGGTSFSMLRTLSEAYKVLQLQRQKLHPLLAFYWITLGNARRLQLDAVLGNFAVGKEADFVLMDLAATPLQSARQSNTHNLTEILFALMMLGDEHNVARTYVMGQLMFERRKGEI